MECLGKVRHIFHLYCNKSCIEKYEVIHVLRSDKVKLIESLWYGEELKPFEFEKSSELL